MKILARRFWVILLVNLALGAVLAEAAGVAVYGMRFKELFYKRQANPVIFERPIRNTGWFGFHPYWAFSQKPGTDATFLDVTIKANNHGFQDPRDYPVKLEPGDYIVGIFGGSVAAGYRFAELKTRDLENGLKALPQLNGRRPVILNFAASSLKQPQQLIILNHYLAIGQHFDAIVAIDGFNELVSGSRNIGYGVADSMPPYDTVRSLLLTLAAGGPMAHGISFAWYQQKSRSHEQTRETCAFALCYWGHDAAMRYYRWLMPDVEAASSTDESAERSNFVLQTVQPAEANDRPAMFERIAEVWARSSAQMALLAASQRALYLNVFQPDQYHKTERVFSPQEAVIAFSLESHVRLPVIEGYPRMLSALRRLREEGINAVDGTRMFDAEPRPVYIDNCCHWGDLGYALMTSFIVAEMAKAAAEKPVH